MSNNARWEPHKQNIQIDPNNPPALEGYFTAFTQRDGGQNGMFMVSTITLINPDGSIGDDIDVAGGIALENAMREVPLNTYVRLEYHGKKASKGGRTFNDFRALMDIHATRYDQRPDVIASGVVSPPPQRQAPAPAAQHPIYNQQQQPGLQQNNQFLSQGQQQQWQWQQPAPTFQPAPTVTTQQTFQAPPVFNQPPTVQTFTPQPPAPQQSTQRTPPVQQRSFTPPPTSQNTPPQTQPTFQAPPQNPQNGIFGGQPVNDPFGNGDLPF